MKKFPFHPFLFALFPVLSLFAQNADQMTWQGIVRSLVLTLLFVSLVWLVSAHFLKDLDKSAFVCTVFVLLFFSFGHMITLTRAVFYNLSPLNPYIGVVETTPSLTVVFVVWMVLFVLLLKLVTRLSKIHEAATAFLNFFSAVLVLLVVFNWASKRAGDSSIYDFVNGWHPTANVALDCHALKLDYQPDIYYIILDGYARQDMLQSLYSYDNSSLATYLKQKNFYVAERSTSNYAQTALSLASSMNYTYLDDIARRLPRQSANRLALTGMIENSQVATELEEQGYSIILFSNEVLPPEYSITDSPWYPNAFEDALINTTPVSLFLRLPFIKDQYAWHREQILYSFDHAPEVAHVGVPTFTLVHILAPHPPFVFSANGEPRAPDRRYDLFDGSQFTATASEQEYLEGYRGQVAFVTAQAQGMIEKILTESPEPPIIILQSDHGSGMQLDWENVQNTNIPERMSILNAYYFPDHDYREIYPQITPVNTFRVMLNHFFGACNPLLPDKNYFSTFRYPYAFIDVTAQANQKLVFDH